MTVYAWSDIHVDYPPNHQLIKNLSRQDYQADTLLLAGDVTDNLERLGDTLSSLKACFKQVFFVPGNHELWVRRGDGYCSLEKLARIIALCSDIGVETRARTILDRNNPVRIEPLLSWYTRPEEGGDSLYLEKIGEDSSLSMWTDTHRIRWSIPESHQHACDFLLSQNAAPNTRVPSAPVISLSHFMPLKELIFPGEVPPGPLAPYPEDPYPTFNFTRVAGSTRIDESLRSRGAQLHVYGHQHRNKWRHIKGVWYVSHCLGYPGEPATTPTGNRLAPLAIWPLPESQAGFIPAAR